jgi:predicted metalloprotease
MSVGLDRLNIKENLKVKVVWLLCLTALLLVLGVVQSVATEPATSAPAARPTDDREAIPQVGAPSSTKVGAPTDEMGSMISGVLGELDDRWSEVFSENGQTFTGPKIVLFHNVTNGGRCGMAQSAMGPFYCAPDQKIYLDTDFFREVETRLHGCSGNTCKFTAAYIIAREVGHHVQNLLGVIPRVTQLQQQVSSKAEANALQVRVELQADCLAGLWVNREAKRRPGFLEAGDIEAVLTTASALGDDTLQQQATGHVVPDSFTHGSAAQRRQWFTTGVQQGLLQACNTFERGAL